MSGDWSVRESGADVDRLAAAASRLTLSNGYVGVRGVLDEAEPDAGPGTLLAAAYDEEELTYPEPSYGDPSVTERLVPVADVWRLAWSVDGHPLDLRTGTLEEHERVLDLRRGVLDRTVRWRAPSGAVVVLRNRRLVPLARRGVVGSWWEVTVPPDGGADAVEVAVRPATTCHDAADDGRAGARAPVEGCGHAREGSWVAQRTVRTGIGVAARSRHLVEADDGVALAWRERPDGGHAVGAPSDGGPDARPTTSTLVARLSPGRAVRVVVLAAYAAGPGTATELAAAADAELDDAVAAGWPALVDEQHRVLDAVWARGDVLVEGDDQVQQAVRFAVLHTVQAAAQVAGVGIRAKGLTGTGYHGHTFWDSECFVLPVLDHVLPAGAADHLRWRHATLPQARARAAELGLSGAAFPWRTISGAECSGYWPAGTAAFHISADVALAAVRHHEVTGDDALAREVTTELCVETARMWAVRGHHTPTGFRIQGVTGPDEYTAVVDDNAYTNLLARRNLRAAVDLTDRHRDVAARLHVTEDERAAWARAADRTVVPRSAALGVTEQCAGFTERAPWHFRPEGSDQYPLADHAPFAELYRHQVVKQADVVMALHLVGDEFSPEQKRRDLEYYEPLTVRDSSLSAPAQAVVAAEVGHGDLAWAYTRETALLDLLDLDGSTHEGLHVAALAGTWTALVAGFGGLRHDDGALRLAPRLPRALGRMRFRVTRGDAVVEVDVRADEVTYTLLDGARAPLVHHGEALVLEAGDGAVVRRPVPPWPDLDPPAQPPGRTPRV